MKNTNKICNKCKEEKPIGLFYKRRVGVYHSICKLCSSKNKYPLYRVWRNMITRCYNKKDVGYSIYGGLGIRVCDEWINSYDFFKDWAVKNGWAMGLHLDRYPNNRGNYSPNNCRFVTPTQNQRNRTNNVVISFNNITKVVSEWAEITGIPIKTLYTRRNRNWLIKDLLTTPSKTANQVIFKKWMSTIQ